MKWKKEYEQLLSVILEDLRVCISYTPNQENDLLCFMEQYIKAPRDLRQSLLSSIRACMDGKEYPNPYTLYQHYREKEINLLEQLLRAYLADMENGKYQKLTLQNLVIAVGDLHNRCCGQLIDNWRREQLIRLLLLPIVPQSLASLQSMLIHQCLW